MAVADLRVASAERITRRHPRAIGRIRVDQIALAAVLVAFAGEALAFAFYGYLNRDEGWYLVSGDLAWHGQMPYRDFPYFQTPLLPYLFGGTQLLFGHTIIAGRITSMLFGFASIALVLYIGDRLGGRAVGLIAAVVLLVTPDFMLASVTARSEAIVIPLTLAALASALRYPKGFAGFVIAPALLLIATGARLTYLPALALALPYCYLRACPTRRETAIAVSILLAIAVAMCAPFVIAEPHRFFFDVWSAQSMRNTQFAPGANSFMHDVANRIFFVDLPWQTFFVVVVAVIFVAVFVVDAFSSGWRPSRTGFGEDVLSNYILIIGFAVALWLPFAGFDHQEPRYFVPSLALLALLGADLFVRSRSMLFGERMRLVAPVLAVLFVAHVLFQVPALREAFDAGDIRDTNETGRYIASIMSPDEQMVAFNPTLAVAADRRLAPELYMGQFSFWPRMSTADAKRNGVVNLPLLDQMMLDPRTRVIALDDYDLSLVALSRDEDTSVVHSRDWPFKLFPELQGRFEVVEKVPAFGQFSGTLYILRRLDAR